MADDKKGWESGDDLAKELEELINEGGVPADQIDVDFEAEEKLKGNVVFNLSNISMQGMDTGSNQAVIEVAKAVSSLARATEALTFLLSRTNPSINVNLTEKE